MTMEAANFRAGRQRDGRSPIGYSQRRLLEPPVRGSHQPVVDGERDKLCKYNEKKQGILEAIEKIG